MKTAQLTKAEKMAASGYQLRVEREDEHDGPPIYVAYIPEIPQCVAQADSPENARAELQNILVDVIAYMLESGLEVPAPETRKGTATVQVGESQAALSPDTKACQPPVITSSDVSQPHQSLPHTSWAVASVPSRIRA